MEYEPFAQPCPHHHSLPEAAATGATRLATRDVHHRRSPSREADRELEGHVLAIDASSRGDERWRLHLLDTRATTLRTRRRHHDVDDREAYLKASEAQQEILLECCTSTRGDMR